jgi:hypothetical protein
LAKIIYDQEALIFKKSSTTDRKYQEALQKHKTAVATLARTRALVRKGVQALEARIGAEHTLVSEVKALLARLLLEWTMIYSPTTGFVSGCRRRRLHLWRAPPQLSNSVA